MSDVKRYYVGINTKCLGGIGLVEMTDLYREATGFDGLVMGEDYDTLKAENESLRADAERYQRLKLDASMGGSLIEWLDCNVPVKLWDSAIDRELEK